MALAVTTARPAFIARSDALRTDYVVYADAPSRSETGKPLPALVVLDGDHFFDAAVAASRELLAAREIEPVVVVGIGYGKHFGDPGNFRGRDFTPTFSEDEPSSGGAPAFLRYFGAQLWPELEERLALDRGGSVLAGHSLSALFVLFALFQAEPVLRRALAGAPSIWWDKRSLLTHMARLHEQQDVLDAELRVAVGQDETPSMLGDLELFDQLLRERPFAKLRWSTQRFAERDHYNLLPDLFRSGLRTMFSRQSAP